MSIQGELNITLSPAQGTCVISSTRPIQAGRLFSGKSIADTLEKIPLLFSICAKAQTISTARAIESALTTPASSTIESHREVLVTLENLREQTLRLLMDWPSYINEDADRAALSHIAQGISHLMLALEPQYLLSYLPSLFPSPLASSLAPSDTGKHINSRSQKDSHQALWQGFSQKLEQILFASTTDRWLDNIHHSVDDWAAQQQTQTARFIHWLKQKDWKDFGAANLTAPSHIDDHELVARLVKEQEAFTYQPDWQGNCHEVSWFSRQKHHAVIATLSSSRDSDNGNSEDNNGENNNGIYVRMLARLIEVADLMQKLERFFVQGALLQPILSNEKGLSHTEAARGRLTHYVELENKTIKRLTILAPTEWNFHPQGVAQQSLQNLLVNNATAVDATILRRQADMVIHAIDPCVGYQLHIETTDEKVKVTH